ncbi:MAG TPA: ABC transporter substrate-binding protein [Candidatus Binatia bacterium]|jgi:ABC-type nitrate/sulfonate/bicarbonate transport system substrate-binding protein
MRSVFALVILVIFCVTSVTVEAAEKRQKIRLGVSSKSLGFWDTWVAHEKGFFRKYGLDSEVITIRPNLAIVALLSGELDYSTVSGTVIRAAIKGLPVRLFTIGLRSSFHVLVGQPGFSSIADLKGKRIAVSNVGATDEIVSRFLLQKAGLDSRRDVVLLSMGGSEVRLQALVSGQTDATALSLPHSLIAKQQGYRILGSAADALEIPFSGLGTTLQKIKRDREQVKRVIRAELDTMHWIKTQKQEAIQFLKQHFGADDAMAAESYSIYTPLILDDVKIRPALIKTVLGFEGDSTTAWDKVADATLVEEVLTQKTQ